MGVLLLHCGKSGGWPRDFGGGRVGEANQQGGRISPLARILLVYVEGTLASGKFLPQQRMRGALPSSQINHSCLFVRAKFYFSFCWVGKDLEGVWEFGSRAPLWPCVRP